MADFPETRRTPPATDPADLTTPPYGQTNTTVNVPVHRTPAVWPALGAAAVVAIVGLAAWNVLDDDTPVTPAPAAQTTAPEAPAPAAEATPTAPAPAADAAPDTAAAPTVVPDGDPAPANPPAGDPPATPPATAPATPPAAAPGN